MEKQLAGLVTVGEKGQVVIPSSARKSLHINTKDKLLTFVIGNYIVLEKPNKDIADLVIKSLKEGLKSAKFEDIEKMREESDRFD